MTTNTDQPDPTAGLMVRSAEGASRTSQVGYSRLAHSHMPISGEPEIGGRPSFETAASQPPQDEAGRSLRWASDMLCLWCLCANPACRRARACKRDPRDCVARFAPLVPEDVRFGVAIMHEGRQYGLSYDEVREDAPAEIAAVENWIARVDATLVRTPLP